MHGALITNLTHFLDERGCIGPCRGPARRLAKFLTQIVATVTHDLDEPLAPIACRHRPGRRPCGGRVDATFGIHDEIYWCCTSCRASGVITHWQGTFWDLMNIQGSSRVE